MYRVIKDLTIDNLIVKGTAYFSSDLDIRGSLTFDSNIYITRKEDFPTAVSGVITLNSNYTYIITTEIDLEGDRLVFGTGTVLIGTNTENCILKSTGLTDPLITSTKTISLRYLTLEVDYALNLTASISSQNIILVDIYFLNCLSNTISGYDRITINQCQFNSIGLSFEGTIGTINIFQNVFQNDTGTCIIVPASTIITDHISIIHSEFFITGSCIGINVSESATIPTECYRLESNDFSGNGTYITGVTHTSNLTLFRTNLGIDNTSIHGHMYMVNNVTATTILNTSDYYKIAGTTIAGSVNEKFTPYNWKINM